MLVDFDEHLRRQIFWQWLGMTVVSALLVFALVRNSAALDLSELLCAAFAIIWGVSFAVLRDQPGYWVYSTLAPKFLIDRQALEQIHGLRATSWVRAMSPIQWPYFAPSLFAVSLAGLLWACLSLAPDYRLPVLIGLVVIVFPLLLCVQVMGAALYFVMLASPEGETQMLANGARRRRAGRYQVEDLLVSLAITYALIWPLRGNPAFDPAQGYASANFISATLMLCWVAIFFMSFGARRSRVMVHVGERLSGLFSVPQPTLSSSLASLSLLVRALLYACGSGLWAVAWCVIVSVLQPSMPFPLFCLLLLPALGLVYWLERGLSIAADVAGAQQFIEEMQVAPASVARRGFGAA